uniref:Uncharacterized protein n=1 Tax=Cacopsylla melanoneura TaxID=428564 RepID=A0A8D8W0W6_9HEMI
MSVFKQVPMSVCKNTYTQTLENTFTAFTTIVQHNIKCIIFAQWARKKKALQFINSCIVGFAKQISQNNCQRLYLTCVNLPFQNSTCVRGKKRVIPILVA